MTLWLASGATDTPAPALFLDRDGVVMRDKDYLGDPAGVEVLAGAVQAMKLARAAGYLLIGVSNQSGLGRGYFSPADLDAVMAKLAADLARGGASFDGFYFCPHRPAADCECRKPRTGLLVEAARQFTWVPARSWVIGDKPSDVELGQNAGLGSVLVRTGYGTLSADRVRDRWSATRRVLIADDLLAAVELILATDAGQGEGPDS